MIRGKIGPKGRPGFLHPHSTGVINLVGERRFTVDERPRQPGEPPPRVIDEWEEFTNGEGQKARRPKGDLVLTREVFDSIRAEIAAGASMFIEPIAGDDEPTELDEARREVDRLRLKLDEAGREIDHLRGLQEPERARFEVALREERDRTAAAKRDLEQARARIAELEAAAQKAPPAAAPTEKPAKPK